MEQITTKWICGLSNGKNVTEGGIDFEDRPGELSSWNKLQAYIKANDLKITALWIKQGDRVYNLPSNNPRFGGLIPFDYTYGRRVAGDVTGSGPITIDSKYIFISAIYAGFTVTLYVDELHHDSSWVAVTENDHGK